MRGYDIGDPIIYDHVHRQFVGVVVGWFGDELYVHWESALLSGHPVSIYESVRKLTPLEQIALADRIPQDWRRP